MYSEVPPHSSQNDNHYKVYKYQVLGRVWRKGNSPPPTLLVGMQIGASIREKQYGISSKSLKQSCHMIQESHSWAYIQRKP